jgi:(2Fe-2S) ferredoxin
MRPYYSHHVFCCQNRRDESDSRGSCGNKGADVLRDYMKDRIKSLKMAGPGKIRINTAGCLDRCELGPVIVVYPDETWYHVQNTADIDKIIEQHLINGSPVESLRLKTEQKRL